MRVTFFGGPISGRVLHVDKYTRTITVPLYNEARAVWRLLTEEVPIGYIPYAVYRIIPVFGTSEEAHGVLQ